MAALNRQQVAAGVMATALTLGVCACTPDSNNGEPSPGPTIEHIVEPDPGPSTPPSAPPDEQWPGANGFGTVPDGLEFAAFDDGYEFSDMPQSSGEQWIYDNYPHFWEQGIRAVSSVNTMLAYDGSGYEPGATVQYINGERFEGTPEVPLGFRGQVDGDPNEFATDIHDNLKKSMKDLSKSQAEIGNTGQGGYEVSIMFTKRDRGSGYALNVTQLSGRSGMSDANSPRMFDTYDQALDWALNNPITFNKSEGDGLRELNRGEISAIVILREKSDGPIFSLQPGVYNPDTGKIEWVS